MATPSDPRSARTRKAAKAEFQELRRLDCERLWHEAVPRFERATAAERVAGVAVIRAVATVFAASGSDGEREAARAWCRRLLHDPCEKVRRYAASALPTLGGSLGDEAALLACLHRCTSESEQRVVARALGMLGGTAALAQLRGEPSAALREAAHRIEARLARSGAPSKLRLDAVLGDPTHLCVLLRWRRGFETILAEEVDADARRGGPFRVEALASGRVEVRPTRPFSLTDLLRLRCFDTVAFRIAAARSTNASAPMAALAAALASAPARRVLATLTSGAIRYRLEFEGKGHQRAAVRDLAARARATWPELLNDPSAPPWTVSVTPAGDAIDLVPHVDPDPRFDYRQGDVPAASHPCLAACMARLCGPMRDEIVWDPFCGSGLELVERTLLGGVRRVLGTDLDPGAVRIARANFAAAALPGVAAEFAPGDFRGVAEDQAPGSFSLVLTNPPMGRRVPTADVHGLVAELMTVAARVLRPGGRLVLPNPVHTTSPPRTLRLGWRRRVDFGGFACWLERYVRHG